MDRVVCLLSAYIHRVIQMRWLCVTLLPVPNGTRNVYTELRSKERLNNSICLNDSDNVPRPVVFYCITTATSVIDILGCRQKSVCQILVTRHANSSRTEIVPMLPMVSVPSCFVGESLRAWESKYSTCTPSATNGDSSYRGLQSGKNVTTCLMKAKTKTTENY